MDLLGSLAEGYPGALGQGELPSNATVLDRECGFCVMTNVQAPYSTYTTDKSSYIVSFDVRSVPQTEGIGNTSVILRRGKVSCRCGSNVRERMKELENAWDPCARFWEAEWRACVLSGRGYWSDWEELLDTIEPDCLVLADEDERRSSDDSTEVMERPNPRRSKDKDDHGTPWTDLTSCNTALENEGDDEEEAEDRSKSGELSPLDYPTPDEVKDGISRTKVGDPGKSESPKPSFLDVYERNAQLDRFSNQDTFSDSRYAFEEEQDCSPSAPCPDSAEPPAEPTHPSRGDRDSPIGAESDRADSDGGENWEHGILSQMWHTESWHDSEEEREDLPSEQSRPSNNLTASEGEGGDPDSVELCLVTEPGQSCPYCHEPDTYDHLVGCDGCEAWIHLSCAYLSHAPKGAWYCRECAGTNHLQPGKRRHTEDDDEDEAPPPKRQHQKLEKSEKSSCTTQANKKIVQESTKSLINPRKASDIMPGPRLKTDKDRWTADEEDATAILMQEVLDEKMGPHKTQAKWRVISSRLKRRYDIDKQPDAISNKWKRKLRAKYNIDERNHKKPDK